MKKSSTFKTLKKTKIFFATLFAFLLVGVGSVNAVTTYYSRASTNWATTTTWSTVSYVSSTNSGTFPVAGDIVNIGGGFSVTVAANAACATISIANSSTLNVGAFTLTVSGTTTVGGGASGALIITSATGTKTFTGAVVINSGASITENFAAALVFGNNVTITGTLTENGAATVSFAGNLTNNGTYNASTGVHTFSGTGKTIGGTSQVSIPSLTISGTTTNNGTLTVSTTLAGASTLTNGATGTLNFGGASITPTLTATAGGNTVNYTAAAQTVKATTYSNLTLSGSGLKTIGAVSVSGILSIEGTATLSAAPTWSGTAYTLQYKTTDTRTAGAEWTTPFAGTGGVIIANTAGSVTMNSNEILGSSVPLTISSGATLATNNFQLNLGGNFVNNGGTFTAGSSNIVIENTANQSIAGFTTTGAISMTKTAGTATFQANVNGGTLTVNGVGGTLNLGPGTSHTFIGANINVNAGTLALGTTNALASSSNIALGGGVFSTSGYSETPGTLILNANSTIALGSGAHSLSFEASNFETWSSGTMLTITGWNGGYNGTAGAEGQIFVGTNTNGLTAAQTSQVLFFDGTDYYTATMLATGEVVPTSTTVVPSLSYASPNSLAQSVAIVPLSPTINFPATGYSVSPALPTNLTLNTSTGVISGTPNTIQGPASYTITATDGTNSKNFVISITVVTGQIRYAVANNNWNSTATWSNSSGGTSGYSVPVAGDAVVIDRANTVTVTAPAACASISISNTTNASSTLTISGTNTLSVSGAVTMARPFTAFVHTIAVGAGTLTAGSLTMSASTTTRNDIISISTGTVTINGATATGTTGCQFTFSDAGTLNFNGIFTSTPTITTVAGSTVMYTYSGTQTVVPTTYYNLTLGGSAVKTTTGITVNDVLSMEGTATASAVPTYGAVATLQYKGSAAQTTGVEFPASFTPSASVGGGGVIIDNINGVTLSAAKTIGYDDALGAKPVHYGSLALINGILTTNGNLLTIASSAVTAIVGGSSTSYVNGTLVRWLPAGLTTGFNYIFPIGVGTTYLPFSMVNATTPATPTTPNGAVVQVQAYNTSSGGSANAANLNSISSTEYWNLTVNSGTLSGSSVSLGRQTPIYANDVVAGSTTKTGTYTTLGGTSDIYNVSASSAIGTNRFFVLGAGKVAKITTSTSNLTGFNYIYNFGPSDEQTFTLNGTSLSANITVTPSSNMQISTASGTGFQDNAMIVSSSNNVIYVRLKAGLAVGNYNSDNITLTSGATTNTIACRGVVLSSTMAVTAGGGKNCSTGNIDLTSSKPTPLYWSGPNGFTSTDQNPQILSTKPITAADYGTYTVTKSQHSGVNLVTNGDFELGNLYFGTSYGNSNNLAAGGEGAGEGLYAVVNNPNSVHSGFQSMTDHSGSGKMMVINGSGFSGTVLWTQTVNVTPGTYYEFSYYLANVVVGTPTKLQLYVNGIPAGPIKVGSNIANDYGWYPYYYNWNSGTNTTAFLSIIDQEPGAGGNDFALDDIMFQSVLQITSSVNVPNSTVASVSIAASATNVRAGTSVTFTATPTNGGATPSYQWYNGTTPVGTNSEVYSYVPSNGDQIKCIMTTSNACVTSGSPATSNIINMIVTVRTNYWLGVTSSVWNDATNWTGGFVPASGYDVEFATVDNNNGIPASSELVLDFNRIVGNLINASSQRLVIPSDKILLVNNTIQSNADPNLILIQASSSANNGTLLFTQPTLNTAIQATVEMYSKGNYSATGYTDPVSSIVYHYNWQYFGIPVKTLKASPTFDGSYVRRWVESGKTMDDHWVSLTNSYDLVSFKGYEITQNVAVGKTITFQGELETGNYSSGALPITYVAPSDPGNSRFPGQQVLANPYTAAIDIRGITLGSGAEQNIYLYNTGSFASWTTQGGSATADSTSSASGQYISVPFDQAGYVKLPRQIPSMQAFLIRPLTPTSSNYNISINYSTVVMKNISMQRVSSDGTSSNDKICTLIEVKGEHAADRMWLFTDPACTRGFDNGKDGQKISGSALTPQLFAMEADGNYQVNAVPDVHDTELGFQAGQDVEDTLTFTHYNIEKRYAGMYLQDLVENKIVDITVSGTKYTFMAASTPEPVKRFRIVTRPYEKDASDAESMVKVFSSRESIFVQNFSNLDGECMIYDIAGHYTKKMPFIANGVTTITSSLKPGAYIAMAITTNEKVSKRLIVR